MSRMISLTKLMLQSRQRADMVNSLFVSDSELISYINNSSTELHDKLVEAYGDDYFNTYYTFTTTQNLDEYLLPNDFYKLKRLAYQYGTNWFQIKKYQTAEEQKYSGLMINIRAVAPYVMEYRLRGNAIKLIPPPPLNSVTIQAQYVQRAYTQNQITITLVSGNNITAPSHGLISNQPVYIAATAGASALPSPLRNDTAYYVNVIDLDTVQLCATPSTDLVAAVPITLTTTGTLPLILDTAFDGINGWEEYIIIDSAIKMLTKQESDTSAFERQLMKINQRIDSARLNRDAGMPNRITDVTYTNNPFINPPFWY